MTLNFLSKDFDMINSRLLKVGDKLINQILNIFQCKKVKNINK